LNTTYEWVSADNFSAGEWDKLVDASNEGTIFQTRRFLSYHPAGKFQDCSLALTKRGNLFGVFPAAIRERISDTGKKQPWLISHPGASYGGIHTRKIVGFDETLEIGQLLLETVGKLGLAGVEMTPPPLPYHKVPSDVWNFAYSQLGFLFRKRDYTQVVPLWIGDPAERYDNKSRGALRHSIKCGIEIKEVELSEENWDIFHPMLVENRKKHHVTPAHSREDLTVLTRLIPETLRLYFAYDSTGKVVAGTLIFIPTPHLHLTFYIAHMREHEDLKAVIPLNDFSIRQALAAGAKWLDFGISTVNGVPGPGLIRFKENFGAVGAWRDVYYKEIL